MVNLNIAQKNRLSLRTQCIGSSPTMNMFNKTNELRKAGKDVLSLSIGEPNVSTEENIKSMGIDAIATNKTKYTASDGISELKSAITRKFKRDNRLNYSNNQVLVCNGTKPLLLNAMLSTLDIGDEVIIPTPYWVSYVDLAILVGAKPVFLKCEEKNGFRFTSQQLKNVITRRSKLLLLNTPSNPTGAVYSKQQLTEISDVILTSPKLIVIADEIYEHIRYEEIEYSSLASISSKIYNRVITLNGLSKGYAMPGWRVGFAGGPEDIISAMSSFASHNQGSPNHVSQIAAIEALDGCNKFLKKNAKSYELRRDFAVNKINEIPGLQCTKPDGAFYLYINCSQFIGSKSSSGRTITNDEDFTMELLDAEGVSTVHGDAFGLSPYFRISYATSSDILEEALNRLERFCKNLKATF